MSVVTMPLEKAVALAERIESLKLAGAEEANLRAWDREQYESHLDLYRDELDRTRRELEASRKELWTLAEFVEGMWPS